jgi:hypothetical protein
MVAVKALTVQDHQAGHPDFCWGVEGEIAVPTLVVCGSRGCGCDRSHTGLSSRAASSTLMVREVDLGVDDLVLACAGFLEAAWGSLFDRPVEVWAQADAIVTDSVEVASGFAVGTVLRPLFYREREQWFYEVI